MTSAIHVDGDPHPHILALQISAQCEKLEYFLKFDRNDARCFTPFIMRTGTPCNGFYRQIELPIRK
jgi:hypothetical protein